MDGGVHRPDVSFRVSPVDHLGRKISPSVLSAAEEIAGRAILHAEKLRLDPALAASLLEETAAVVSRAVEARSHCVQNPVRDLRAYLFRAFVRRVNRVKRRELTLVDAIPVHSVGSHNPIALQKKLELTILVDEFLTRCDPVTRDMFYRRIEGFSWKEIGSAYGISSHAAESRFSQAIHRIKQILGLEAP